MAEHDIFANIFNTSADGIDIASGDSLYLAPGVIVAGGNGHVGIGSTAGETLLTIAGTVFGSEAGIQLGFGINEIFVTATGAVSNLLFDDASAAILIDGGANLISNAGDISGSLYGVSIGSNGNQIANRGTIEGGAAALDLASGGDKISNTGLIECSYFSGTAIDLTGTGGEDSIVNSGTISGESAIYEGSTQALSVFNSGLIQGSVKYTADGGIDTLDNSGTMIGTVEEQGTAELDVRNSGLIENNPVPSSVQAALGAVAGATMNISNSGTIVGFQAILFDGSATDVLTNDGTLQATGAAVLESGTAVLDAVNDGHITGATGIQFNEGVASGDTLHNGGTIAAHTVGVVENAAGLLSVYNSGSILGAIGVHFNGATGFADVLDNQGTIRGPNVAAYESGTAGMTITNEGLIIGSRGVLLGANSGDSTIDNSGTIQGSTFAIDETNLSDLNIDNSGIIGGGTAIALLAPAGQSDVLDNTGIIRTTLSGGIAVDESGGLGNLAFTNSGHVTGLVNLGAGNDSYDGSLGSVTGTVSGNAGNDVLTGGKGVDILSGGAGNDVLTGNDGNDVLNPGASNDVVNGGNGNDTLVMGAGLGATDTIDGGSGLDTMTLAGDYSAGVTFLATTMISVEALQLTAGHSYKFTTADATVAAGATLTVTASTLGAADVLTFNGAAETDGHFVVYGGAGNDVIGGGDLSDVLVGNLGSDHFVYQDAGQSTGVQFDTIVGFDATADKFDLDTTVSAIDATVSSGLLGTSGFDTDLASVITAAHLVANHAVLFTPTTGNLKGDTFLIVDANGVAGYQPGQDYVFELATPQHLTSLSAGDFI